LRSFSSEVGVIIRVQQEDFDSVELQRQLAAGRNDIGAIATFIGLVRDLEGDPLQQMTLEHYPGMTEKALEGIAMRASERWQVIDGHCSPNWRAQAGRSNRAGHGSERSSGRCFLRLRIHYGLS
jgi:hypothetical protein